jgi:hypothetical protein
MMTSMQRVLISSLLVALPLLACGGDDSPSRAAAITLSVTGPITATEGSSVDCAVFPVQLTNPGDESGRLDALETTVIRTDDSTELATNRRPNETFVFPESDIPAAGTLEAEAAVCWPPEPAGTGLAVRVRAELSPGGQRPAVQVTVIGPRD